VKLDLVLDWVALAVAVCAMTITIVRNRKGQVSHHLPYEHDIESTTQLPTNLDTHDVGMWFTDGTTRYTWVWDWDKDTGMFATSSETGQ
jgi:hypothetical protein